MSRTVGSNEETRERVRILQRLGFPMRRMEQAHLHGSIEAMDPICGSDPRSTLRPKIKKRISTLIR